MSLDFPSKSEPSSEDNILSESSLTPSVVIFSVANPGNINASFPWILMTVCSKTKGWSLTSPFISTLKVTVVSLISIIVNTNTIPSGNTKGISKVLSSLRNSGISTNSKLNSNFPSLIISFVIFPSNLASVGGSIVAFLSKSFASIAASVKTGFNKVLLAGRPATNSDEAISIDSRPSVSFSGILHSKETTATGLDDPSTLASRLFEHVTSTGSGLFPLPNIIIIIKVILVPASILSVVKPMKLNLKFVLSKSKTCLKESLI